MDRPTEYPFVGREAEKAVLQQHLREAVVHKRGYVVFTAGEAGIGKTTLVREFLTESQRRYNRLLVATGTCDAITGIGAGFQPFIEILIGLLGGQQPAGTPENARRLHQIKSKMPEIMLELGPDLLALIPIAGPIAGLLLKSTAVAAKALGFPRTKPAAPADDSRVSELSQEQFFEQYLRVLQSVAAEHPLVLVLDDLQWADQSSLNLLFHLGRRIGGDRILVIGLYRPSDVHLGRDGQQHPLDTVRNELGRYGVCHTISLSGLAPADVRQYLDQRFRSHQFPTKFVELIVDFTEGNPLFLVELLEHLKGQGQIVYQEGLWQLATEQVAVESLPDSLEAVISERVGRLTQELQDILAYAIVFKKKILTLVLESRLQPVGSGQKPAEASIPVKKII